MDRIKPQVWVIYYDPLRYEGFSTDSSNLLYHVRLFINNENAIRYIVENLKSFDSVLYHEIKIQLEQCKTVDDVLEAIDGTEFSGLLEATLMRVD